MTSGITGFSFELVEEDEELLESLDDELDEYLRRFRREERLFRLRLRRRRLLDSDDELEVVLSSSVSSDFFLRALLDF